MNIPEVTKIAHLCLRQGKSLSESIRIALDRSENEWLQLVRKYKLRAEKAETELAKLRASLRESA